MLVTGVEFFLGVENGAIPSVEKLSLEEHDLFKDAADFDIVFYFSVEATVDCGGT